MISILAKQLFNETVGQLSSVGSLTSEQRSDMKALIHAQLESALKQANLVSRTEFEAQKEVLERTQKQLKALEEKLIALENSMPS